MFPQVIICALGYERVYLPQYKEADTPFHIQGDGILLTLYVPKLSSKSAYMDHSFNDLCTRAWTGSLCTKNSNIVLFKKKTPNVMWSVHIVHSFEAGINNIFSSYKLQIIPLPK